MKKNKSIFSKISFVNYKSIINAFNKLLPPVNTVEYN